MGAYHRIIPGGCSCLLASSLRLSALADFSCSEKRNFLLLFCLSRFEYRVRHIYILDAKNIYIIRHALECTFGMGQCVFSDCISVRLKRMAERRHCVDITPIYFPLVWQERSSYRLMNGGPSNDNPNYIIQVGNVFGFIISIENVL